MTDIVERLRVLVCGARWTCAETANALEDAADEIERLRKTLAVARRGAVEAAAAVASKRAASRHTAVAHCHSDRSKKHMQIRADEAGQLVADIRVLLEDER